MSSEHDLFPFAATAPHPKRSAVTSNMSFTHLAQAAANFTGNTKREAVWNIKEENRREEKREHRKNIN